MRSYELLLYRSCKYKLAVVVAEADEMLSLMRLKSLTVEEA